MSQFLWYDCTFKKQCTVPVTLTFDLWRSIYFHWIEYYPIIIMYTFQIDISSNSWEIEYQNIGRTHTHRQTDRVKTIPRNPLRGEVKMIQFKKWQIRSRVNLLTSEAFLQNYRHFYLTVFEIQHLANISTVARWAKNRTMKLMFVICVIILWRKLWCIDRIPLFKNNNIIWNMLVKLERSDSYWWFIELWLKSWLWLNIIEVWSTYIYRNRMVNSCCMVFVSLFIDVGWDEVQFS